VNIKDKKGRTPLFYALEAHGENLDVVMQLLNKGADVNIVSVDGWSPLLKAT
jgi:ankyrin repeat protein